MSPIRDGKLRLKPRPDGVVGGEKPLTFREIVVNTDDERIRNKPSDAAVVVSSLELRERPRAKRKLALTRNHQKHTSSPCLLRSAPSPIAVCWLLLQCTRHYTPSDLISATPQPTALRCDGCDGFSSLYADVV
ncbi:hypothetical protein RP20_CCG000974 [Aedes albopictus]|nr:hypothetical protein RP20_CCG000974 [Aedes albopictus]